MRITLRLLGLDILDLELTTDVTDVECEDEPEDFGITDSTPIDVGFTPFAAPSVPIHIGDGEGEADD